LDAYDGSAQLSDSQDGAVGEGNGGRAQFHHFVCGSFQDYQEPAHGYLQPGVLITHLLKDLEGGTEFFRSSYVESSEFCLQQ
jgi:hypothetical protein